MQLARLLALYASLRRAERLPPERLRRLQERKLKALVAHAHATVPFYRARFERIGLDPRDIRSLDDLAHLPVVGKAELQAVGTEARLSSGFPLEALEHGRTSGSSGRPFEIFRDRHFARLRRAAFFRALCTGPYRPGQALLLVSGGSERRQPRWLRWHYVPSEEDPERVLETMNRLRPRFLYGFLTPLRQLASLVRATGRRVHQVKAVYTTAETLDRGTRTLLTATFGGPVFDIYGTTEAGPIAWECPAHAGYHVAEDTTIVELLPSATPGAHRLVATCLDLWSMPLLRYDVGDLAVAGAADRCACGRTLRRLARIEGRLVDCVRLPDGRTLSPYHLTLAIEEIPGIDRYQIVQTAPDRILVRAQGSGRDDPVTPERITAAVRGVMGRAIMVETRFEADLDPPRGSKFRVVECRIAAPAAVAA
jgi:phenylacetate-CoA ligase